MLVHDFLLKSFSVLKHFSMVFEVNSILQDDIVVNISHILLVLYFRLLSEIDGFQVMLVHILLSLEILGPLNVVHGLLKLHILLHLLCLILSSEFIDALSHLFFLDSLLKLLTVLLLKKLLPDPGLIFFSFVIFCLFPDNGTPLVNLTVSINRIISFLIIIKLLNIFLFMFNRLFDAVRVHLKRVNGVLHYK